MALDRLDLLIRQARERSGNQTFGDSQGVPQRNYVAYANDAQARLFNLIMLRNPNLYTKEGFITTIAGQAAYSLPTDVYLKSRLTSVQFTPNGNAQLYYPLEHRTSRQEVSIPALPDSYFLRDGKMVLSPTPMAGYANAVRINYQYTIPKLDVRRAKVASVGGGGTLITLTNDSTLTQETENDLVGGWIDYAAFVDQFGVQVSTSDPISAYSTATKVLTLQFADPLIQPGQYLVSGGGANGTTTHSSLPDICSRYMVEYMAMRAQVSDTSSEAQNANAVLASIETEILDAVDMLEEVIFAITILDQQFLNYTDDTDY